jgi:hypothetical protein
VTADQMPDVQLGHFVVGQVERGIAVPPQKIDECRVPPDYDFVS